jgi:Fe-S-cluster containining protein
VSLGCARCGDCCDPVTLDAAVYEDALRPWFEYWDGGGEDIPDWLDPTIRFMYEHMTKRPHDADAEQVEFDCAKFDPTTRLCTAHDDTPPMCRNFPWYSDGEGDPYRVSKLPPRCSFALDAPTDVRRPDARPLLPLTVRSRT